MCALTVAPPLSSPDAPHRSSWVVRTTRLRPEREADVRTVPLCFRDLHVTLSDLTTVREAFAGCSAEEMLQAVMRHEVGWHIPVDTIGSRAHHMLAGRIGGALDAMRSLEDAAVALAPSQEGIVGPLFRTVPAQGGGGLQCDVSAAALSFADAPDIRGLLASGMERVCTWDELRTLHRDAAPVANAGALSISAFNASAVVLSRMPWERVLALPLWLPKDLSEDERMAVIAKVFWSMTYRGFEQANDRHGDEEGRLPDERARIGRIDPAVLPADPLMAVLGHNCWVDTLEAWDTLFTLISACETRP